MNPLTLNFHGVEVVQRGDTFHLRGVPDEVKDMPWSVSVDWRLGRERVQPDADPITCVSAGSITVCEDSPDLRATLVFSDERGGSRTIRYGPFTP